MFKQSDFKLLKQTDDSFKDFREVEYKGEIVALYKWPYDYLLLNEKYIESKAFYIKLKGSFKDKYPNSPKIKVSDHWYTSTGLLRGLVQFPDVEQLLKYEYTEMGEGFYLSPDKDEIQWQGKRKPTVKKALTLFLNYA